VISSARWSTTASASGAAVGASADGVMRCRYHCDFEGGCVAGCGAIALSVGCRMSGGWTPRNPSSPGSTKFRQAREPMVSRIRRSSTVVRDRGPRPRSGSDSGRSDGV
jgi:hypothetical protein